MYKKIVLICCVLFMSLALSSCGDSEGQQNSNNPVDFKEPIILDEPIDKILVYFATEDNRYLVPITLPIKPTNEAVKVTVEKVLAGPGDWMLEPTVPPDTKVIDVYLKDGIVYVDLTSHFMDTKNENEMIMALDSIIFSITEFEQVDKIKFLIEGKDINKVYNIDFNGPFERKKTINSFEINDNQKALDVYFSDANAMYLVPVSITTGSSEDIEGKIEKALKTLIKGPDSGKGLIKTIWPNTKLLGFEYKENRKEVVVDLSKEVIGYGGGSAAEILLVNSLIFTLTDIRGVESVRLLIEGGSIEMLPEGWDISKPLVRPEHINLISY